MFLTDYIRNGALAPLDSDWKEGAAIYSIFTGCLISTELMDINHFSGSLVDDCATVSRRLLTHLNETLYFIKIWTKQIGIESPKVEIMQSWLNETLGKLEGKN